VLPARVLLAEDDPQLREILCDGLRDEGFSVVAAEDGVHALELFLAEGPFDVILLDEEMPRLTGREFLAHIRELGEQVPAVIISGSLNLEQPEQQRLGIHDLLRKPTPIAEMAASLRRALSAHPSGEEPPCP
jgi:CheY-like chemotaxis protein